MAHSRYRVFETEYPYFMTCTVVGWLPVFTRSWAVQHVLDSWQFLQKERQFVLYGYVVLENHLHLVASAPELTKVIANFKSFTARQIIDQLEIRGERTLLQQLRWFKADHKSDRPHQLWQEGSHPQQIQNEEMLRQKLEYIHLNPVRRGYVNDPLHWRYSSARDYAGLGGLISVRTVWW